MPDAATPERPASRARKNIRAFGLSIVTGAADDDPSAVGTYASAGAGFGFAFLWTVPVLLPMMFTVVYLSAKLGQVSGRGLFHVLHDFYPRLLLWPLLIGVVFGNIIEAAADLGGMAAALALFVPLPVPVIAIIVGIVLLGLQVFGSYRLLRNLFRWLTLVLLAYVASAIAAQPQASEVLRATFSPHFEFSTESLAMLVAMIGTSLSAYLYTWQSNVEVEEEIAQGRARLEQRIGATEAELRETRRDVLLGMLVSATIMYFIILATAAALHGSGVREIASAADAAAALRPIAGDAASALFTVGIIGVGFLAIPIMTAGAAYDVGQVLGWRCSLHARFGQARRFYQAIAFFTAVAVAINFLGINPMKALVYAGIVQGFSTPPLLLLILVMTSSRRIMGDKVNTQPMRLLGGATVICTFAASAALVVLWLRSFVA